MSYKHTYLAWQNTNLSAHEKLVLLKLADIANSDGLTTFFLSDIASECLTEAFGLSNVLLSLSQKGLLAMGRTEREDGKEKHSCRLTFEENRLPEQEDAYSQTSTQPAAPTITTAENSSAPSWAIKSFDFYNVPYPSRDFIWQMFVRQYGKGNINLPRLERDFENWLEHAKRCGELSRLTDSASSAPASKSKKRQFPASADSRRGNEYINSHDLNEKAIPTWAEQTLQHSGLDIDLSLFWEKFVLYQKTRANDYTTITQLLNKLRIWIANEKQAIIRRKQEQQLRYQQMNDNKSARNVSPSEEFREFLRGQGKNPSF